MRQVDISNPLRCVFDWLNCACCQKNIKNSNLVLTNEVSSYILVFVDETEMYRQQAVRV